jgi:hypothetical protein
VKFLVLVTLATVLVVNQDDSAAASPATIDGNLQRDTLVPGDPGTEEIVQLEGDVEESFGQNADISSPILAGVIAGPLIDQIDFARLRFYVPVSQSSQSICYAASSRNGAYAAASRAGALLVPAGTRVAQPRFEVANQQRLQQFDIEDVAIRARLGRDCATNPNAPYVPAAYQSGRTNLTVMVQSRRSRSATIKIVDLNGRSATGNCKADPTKVSVRFDMVCSAPLAGLVLSGTSELQITMLDRRGKEFVETARLAWS